MCTLGGFFLTYYPNEQLWLDKNSTDQIVNSFPCMIDVPKQFLNYFFLSTNHFHLQCKSSRSGKCDFSLYPNCAFPLAVELRVSSLIYHCRNLQDTQSGTKPTQISCFHFRLFLMAENLKHWKSWACLCNISKPHLPIILKLFSAQGKMEITKTGKLSDEQCYDNLGTSMVTISLLN